MNTRTFTRILQVNKNGLNAYDLRHLTVNLRARELKLIFNLQSSPMGVLFNNCTLIKSGSKQYTSSRFITCQCICFSIFNGVTSLKQIPFWTEKDAHNIVQAFSSLRAFTPVKFRFSCTKSKHTNKID